MSDFMNIRNGLTACLLAVFTVSPSRADGPADNLPNAVRRMPGHGVEVPAAERQALDAGLAALRSAIAPLDASNDPRIRELLPDVLVYEKAVRDALKYEEFFARGRSPGRRCCSKRATSAEQLAHGSPAWPSATGLIVRGTFRELTARSNRTGSWSPIRIRARGRSCRLDLWFHGRGETLSELNFLDEREHNSGDFTPPDTIVLHPYGRYCNAFKFAGEVDVLEAIDAVRRNYQIDDDRISVRGFSMGGAACWQFAVHYSDRWFAANPGAGFAETPQFLKIFQKESLQPAWYEQTLWHLYDCTDYAPNLLQCPTDRLQRGERHSEAGGRRDGGGPEGRGDHAPPRHRPEDAARIHPDCEARDRAPDGQPRRPGRGKRFRESVTLVTYTLKYNRMNWVTIDGLGEHWKKAQVHAEFDGGPELEIDDRERHRADARRPRRGATRYDLTDDGRPHRSTGSGSRAPAVLGPFLGLLSSDRERRSSGSSGRRPSRSASATTCKARSTTPSWTRS